MAVTSTALELAGGDPNGIPSKMQEAEKYAGDAKIFINGKVNAGDNVKKFSAMAVGKETPKKLSELKKGLDNVEMLVAGVLRYTDGVDEAAAGSKKLLQGVTELDNGISGLKVGSDKLSAGSKQMVNGIDMLNYGMNKFDNDGIGKFVKELNNKELTEILDNFYGIKSASMNEVFIGGKSESMSGESKIIFKTGEIK